jgi:branched-chain amino acid transport system permease protein
VNAILVLEQTLNGLQFGLMLFLLAAGLTLVFGIMDMINLAHGSLYMVGAYLIATLTGVTGNFWLGLGARRAGCGRVWCPDGSQHLAAPVPA